MCLLRSAARPKLLPHVPHLLLFELIVLLLSALSVLLTSKGSVCFGISKTNIEGSDLISVFMK